MNSKLNTNMKKKYIAPASEVIAFKAESLMMTHSMDVYFEEEVDGTEALSNRQNGSWNSSLWGKD